MTEWTARQMREAATYAEVKARLGHIIPCYGEPSGCCANDATNEANCCELGGCIMLRLWCEGFDCARAEFDSEPCTYCARGTGPANTGLPDGACENCMNTGRIPRSAWS